jgi:hypothetical protein
VKVLGLVSAVVLIVAAIFAFMGWTMMLAVGVVHSIFDWPISISYVQGIQFAWAVAVIGGIFSSSVSRNIRRSK